MQQRPAATARFATWTRRVNEEDLVPPNQDLGRLEGTGVAKALDHHVHQPDLFVLVEQVGHAIGGEPDPAGQHAILGVRDEVDHGMRQPDRVQSGGGIGFVRTRSLECEEQASTRVVDHVAMVSPMRGRAIHPEVPLRRLRCEVAPLRACKSCTDMPRMGVHHGDRTAQADWR